MPKVVIVGGGISGLSIAFRLTQLDPTIDVTLLEEKPRLGGTVWTEDHAGFRVETGPNGFLDTKPATLALCRDLGLGSRLLPVSDEARRNRYLLLDGRLRRLPDSLLSFLRSDLLSWPAKLAVITERFRRNRPPHGDESVAAFARRRAGREVAEVLADPFVTGIYAGDPALLSVHAAFPRLASLERDHGSVSKGLARAARARRSAGDRAPGPMWSFREGLRLLIETLASRLRTALPGVAVERLEKQERTDPARPTWIIRGPGNDQWPAEAVVLTCPAYRQAALLAELDAALAAEIGAIAYNRVAVVALGYRQADIPVPLDGFGFLARQCDRRDLLGVQWCSSIFPDRAPPGMVLLRAMCGGWQRPEMVGWDDAQLLHAVRAELQRAMGIAAAPVFQRIVRWDRAIPQYLLGHLERVARIAMLASSHGGLFLGGNAYHGVALNDCTDQGEVVARRVLAYVNETPQPPR